MRKTSASPGPSSAGPQASQASAWRHFLPGTCSPRRKPARSIRSTNPSQCRLYNAKRQISALPARALRQGEAGKSKRETPEGGPETSPSPLTEETPMPDRVMIARMRRAEWTDGSVGTVPSRYPDTHHRQAGRSPTTSRAVGVQARTLELLGATRLGGRDGPGSATLGLAASFYAAEAARLSPRLHADRQPLSLPPVHFAGRD